MGTDRPPVELSTALFAQHPMHSPVLVRHPSTCHLGHGAMARGAPRHLGHLASAPALGHYFRFLQEAIPGYFRQTAARTRFFCDAEPCCDTRDSALRA